MSEKKRICILGIDRFAAKNAYQTDWLTQCEFEVDVFATGRSTLPPPPGVRFFLLEPRPWARMCQIAGYLARNRRSLHHIETYVAGRFAFIYLLLARGLRIKGIVVERGDLLYYRRRDYGWSTRLSMYLCYRLARLVWYKELYMKPLLDSMRVSRKILLPNAVPLPALARHSFEERNLDFLWVNRLIPLRHADWFARSVLRLLPESAFSVEIVGFSRDRADAGCAAVESEIRRLLGATPTVSLRDYDDPLSCYPRARFFILPADVVYCNYALLEAMSHGVVPIVSNVEGSDRIVADGISGFVVTHSEEGLLRGMERALSLDGQAWEGMSQAAHRTIRERFSIDSWGKELLAMYDRL